jgi:DNA-binding PadR family transcriptional regulator
MGRPSRIRNAILEALRDHPLMSRRQLELYLHGSSAGVRYGLRELKKHQWIWQTNARQPAMRARAIYALTQAGIQELARQSRTSYHEYLVRYRLSPDRLNRLVLMQERVFQLRTLFLWLAGSQTKRTPNLAGSHSSRKKASHANPHQKAGQSTGRESASNGAAPESQFWQVLTWDVEVGKLFSTKRSAVWIPFHGAAVMRRSSTGSGKESSKEQWAFIVVEFDVGRVAVERDRERLAQFVAAQDDPRYWGKEKEQLFPVLLIVAQDELRLQEYYNVLRSAALARQLPMPRAYLTTVRAMLSLRHDRLSPIWHSTISSHRTSLLFDTEGSTIPLADQTLWRKLPLNETIGQSENVETSGVYAPEVADAETKMPIDRKDSRTDSLSEFARIALTLKPLTKQLLDEIAAHPLLKRQDLSMLLKVSLRRIRSAIAEMRPLKLIEVHEERYLIAPRGQQYLAQVAGFGNAVGRYARARGWGNGFDSLVRHWEHTQAENDFFLALARVARERGHRLTWLSELEARLYYEAGQDWHSFLPDGRGTYIAGRKRYEFALEMDRSRSSLERFRGKFAEYDACVSSNVLRSEGVESLRLLVVTASWERAEAWRRTALEVKVRLPVFITTHDRFAASGVDALIWLRGDVAHTESAAASPKEYCFDCFGGKEDEE